MDPRFTGLYGLWATDRKFFECTKLATESNLSCKFQPPRGTGEKVIDSVDLLPHFNQMTQDLTI